MRSLSIPQIPGCFSKIADIRPNGPWFNGEYDEERSCRKETRKFLLENQNYNCGWCQAKITLLSSHSEHILPKSNPAYSHLTFSISNIVACCGGSSCATCGHHKGQRILANWIHPYHTPVLENSFSYEIDGEMRPIVASEPMRSEAEHAINHVLNLNESVLKTKREKLISDLADELYTGLTSDQIYLVVGEFKSLIEQYAS